MVTTPLQRTCLAAVGIILMVTLLLPGTSHGLDHEVIILFDDYPPYYTWKHNRPQGPFAEIITEAFSRMNVRPVYQKSTFKRALLEIEKGGVNALCSAIRNPEREAYAFYPDEPLGYEQRWCATLKGSSFSPESIADFKGKVIGIVAGYHYDTQFVQSRSFKRKTFMTEDLLIKNLLSNRIDAVIGDRKLLEYMAHRHHKGHLLRFNFMLEKTPIHLLFSKAKGEENRRLAAQFDRTLRSMREDGTVDELLAPIAAASGHTAN